MTSSQGLPAIDPGIEHAVRESFARQGLMTTIGAVLTRLAPGEIAIGLPYAAHITQQNGFIHGGIVASLADTACGYAAMTLAPDGCNPLAVEFKLNLLAPARGERFEARATVLRRGKTLTVARADVFAISGEGEELIATMLETAILRRI